MSNDLAIKIEDRPPQGELTREDRRQIVNLGILNERRAGGNLPDVSNWDELPDKEKLLLTKQLLEKPLWLISEQMGDKRTRGVGHNPLVTPYGNLIMPWPEELLKHLDARDFIERMGRRQLDEMILELGGAGKLLSGQDADDQYLELGSSTGATPSLRQYYFGLKMKQAMSQAVDSADTWQEVSEKLRQMPGKIIEQLKEIYNLPEGVKVLFTQSGTEAELLLSLFGVEAAQFFNETGSATEAALAGRHPSSVTWRGVITDETQKIAGMEKIDDPQEIKLRSGKGDIKEPAVIKREVEEWIIVKQQENSQKRLAIHVIAGGSKTGLAVQGERVNVGGLRIQDAEWLRDKYGGKSGNGIIVVVDLAQNRLDFGEAAKLLAKKMLVNITGSKFPGGAMFSHAMLVPPELVTVMQAWVKENGIPDGLKDYLTKGDLADALDDKLMPGLPDFPDIPSMCKWAEAIPVMKEYKAMVNDWRSKLDFQTAVYDFMNLFRRKIGQQNQKSPINWRVEWLNKRNPWQYQLEESIGLQALKSFFVVVEGRRLSVAEIKELYGHLSDYRDGQGIHLGQAVEIDEEFQEAVLRIAPSMEFLLRMRYERNRENFDYEKKVADRLAVKLAQVIEGGYIAATPALTPLAEKPALWSKWVSDNNAIFETALKQCTTMEQKLRLSVSMLAQMWKGGRVAPVVVASGKSAAVLETAFLALAESGLKGELPIALVDHPYMERETRNTFRAMLLRYQALGEELGIKPHLYVFAAGEAMKRFIEDEAIKPLVTVVSEAPDPHPHVTEDPQWMKHLSAANMTFAEFNLMEKAEFERRQALAKELNEHYKGKPTRELIDFFKTKASAKKQSAQFLRGIARRQQFREAELLIKLPQSKTFFSFHPLIGFTEKDMIEFIKEHLILQGTEYDPFKEVADSLRCGLDLEFENY